MPTSVDLGSVETVRGAQRASESELTYTALHLALTMRISASMMHLSMDATTAFSGRLRNIPSKVKATSTILPLKKGTIWSLPISFCELADVMLYVLQS